MYGARVHDVLRVSAQLRSAAPLPPRPAAAAPAPAALSVSASSKSKDKKKDKKKGTVKISRDDIGGPTNFVYALPAVLWPGRKLVLFKLTEGLCSLTCNRSQSRRACWSGQGDWRVCVPARVH